MNSYDGAYFFDNSGVDLVISKLQYDNINDSKYLMNTGEIFKTFDLNYRTNNTELLSKIENEIIGKIKILKKTHENDLTVLIKTREKYNNVSYITTQSLEEVGHE